MKNVRNDNDNGAENVKMGFGQKIGAIASSVGRTTVRTFKNLPHKLADKVKRKITDYKRKPERKDINKVYVLVGYTTKKNIDKRYNNERHMIILRKGLLLIIFFLLLFISINKVNSALNVDEYGEMFGIKSADELTENDPFDTGYTVPTKG